MKWSVIALVVLGTVAALAATVLVNSLRASNQQAVVQEAEVIEQTTIIVAAQNLPKGTFLDRNMVETKQVLLGDVQPGSVSDSEQAVGKALAEPIDKGETLMMTMFAQNLGEALPAGKMLWDVPVRGSSSSLYLGCKVNVIWTPNRNSREEAESKPLMTRISVWGIGDRTIVLPEGPAGRSSSQNKTVMLLLDMDQTQRITAAIQSGTISLPLCNPEDEWAMPAQEAPAVEPPTVAEPSEEWEVLQFNGEKFVRFIWVKEGDVWRLREKQE